MAKSTPVKATGTKTTSVTSSTPVEEKVATTPEVTEPMVNISQSEWETMKSQLATLMANQAMGVGVTPRGSERTIKFINMTPGTLVLKGTSYYSLDGQFASRPFTEREARIIAANMTNTIASGAVFIADAQFVQENDFADAYENLLSADQLKKLLSSDAQSVVEAYKTTSTAQQKIIVNMLKERRMNGQPVDMNVLSQISELCHEDLANITAEDGLGDVKH